MNNSPIPREPPLRIDLAVPDSDFHEYAQPHDSVMLHEIRDGAPSGRFVLAHVVATGELVLRPSRTSPTGDDDAHCKPLGAANDREVKQLREALEAFASRHAKGAASAEHCSRR